MENTYNSGDFILVSGTGFFDKLITRGQSLRFPKEDNIYNHVALIVSAEGDIIEAVSGGVKCSKITKYPNCKIVNIKASAEDRAEAVHFAKSCLKDGYGFITILSSALCLLFGLKFSFGFSAQKICSGLVARSLERTSFIPPRDPENCTPADLAKQFT